MSSKLNRLCIDSIDNCHMPTWKIPLSSACMPLVESCLCESREISYHPKRTGGSSARLHKGRLAGGSRILKARSLRNADHPFTPVPCLDSRHCHDWCAADHTIAVQHGPRRRPLYVIKVHSHMAIGLPSPLQRPSGRTSQSIFSIRNYYVDKKLASALLVAPVHRNMPTTPLCTSSRSSSSSS